MVDRVEIFKMAISNNRMMDRVEIYKMAIPNNKRKIKEILQWKD